jgi:hypothetical protein
MLGVERKICTLLPIKADKSIPEGFCFITV